MREILRAVPFAWLLLGLLPPTSVSALTISLPADSVVTVDSPSRLAFRATNTDPSEGLSRLTLRFPSDYRVTAGSAPSGWIVEQGSGGAEVSFRTADEATCTGAIAPGGSLVFGVEVIAPASQMVTPDSLVSGQGEQSCRGVVLDPPATLPSWNRLGIEGGLAAGPPVLGVGGNVTVTMTATNLSTVELTDISAVLGSAGTAGVSGLAGPSPASLTLAPGASAAFAWTARAASAGTLSFSGQAVTTSVTSPPVRSEILIVGDLDVSLTVSPEQVTSGQDVQVQMTVWNRGPIRMLNVTPSALAFDGTATASAAAGPSPISQAGLEPGESATFTWTGTITGSAGATYAFSGWASAEGGSIVSQNATSNAGTLSQQDVLSGSDTTGGSLLLGGGAADGGTAATAAPSGAVASVSTGGGTPTAVPSAAVRFVALNNDGGLTGGVEFFGSTLRDLMILVGWQNVSGSHSQRLELFTPDGSLYQRFATQFSGGSVETRLPVGGTWITEHSLFGPWRVDVFLDYQQMPMTSGVFVLTP